MGSLTNKVAVVTGVERHRGGHCQGRGRRRQSRRKLCHQQGGPRAWSPKSPPGGKAIAVQGEWQSGRRAAAVRETKQAYGPLDVLVNNAGIYQFAPLDEVTEEQFHRQFNINVLGLILATQQAVKISALRAEASSTSARSCPRTAPAPRSTRDQGRRGLDHPVAGPGARPAKDPCQLDQPGATETEGLHQAGIVGSDYEKQFVANTPLGRLGQPDEIAWRRLPGFA